MAKREEVFDLVIVGAGMIGSAAARYASTQQGLKVCVIGPEEPKTLSLDNPRDIFSSHYDQARITSSAQKDPVWSTLAARSIAQYRNLEKLAGIRFYEECGMIHIGTPEDSVFQSKELSARTAGQSVNRLTPVQAMARFPFLKVQQNEAVLYQQKSGYINPRLHVAAELKVAQNQGCTIIRDVVSRVVYPRDSKDHVILYTDMGNTVYSKKVLLAPGAFMECRQLLLSNLTPHIQLMKETIVLAEVSKQDLEKMKTMPSIVRTIEEDPTHNCYILPPVIYPDGKFYIKLGHGEQFDEELKSSELKQWYCQHAPEPVKQNLVQTLKLLFPDYTPASISAATCVTTRTPTRHVYVDLLNPQLAVAFAGNGYSAKSCDQIGRTAAELVLNGKWSSDLPREWFRFHAKSAAKL